MPGEFEIDTDQIIRESINQLITAGRITLRLSILSIRAARVMISAMSANHERKEELQGFAKRYGMNFGFLEIQTEDRELLSRFENELRGHGIAYSQLPDLQSGDGCTQYLYDLGAIDKLSAIIHQNEENRLCKLADLKMTYTDDPKRFLEEKEKIAAEIPDILLITAEDYAATSLIAGHDTKEFAELEALAEQELTKTPGTARLSDDSEVRDFFEQLSGHQEPRNLQKKPSEKEKPDGKALLPDIPVRRKTR